MTRSWHGFLKLLLLLVLASGAGCQTYIPEVGMTLPTPHYLDLIPEYHPPPPTYPLSNELRDLEAEAAARNRNLP
jgi:hypothetical protein